MSKDAKRDADVRRATQAGTVTGSPLTSVHCLESSAPIRAARLGVLA